MGESLAPGREQQSHDDAHPEHGHRIFVFQADACQHTEPQPQLLITGLDDANDDRGAAHPEEGFEIVGPKQMAVDDEDGGNRHRQS